MPADVIALITFVDFIIKHFTVIISNSHESITTVNCMECYYLVTCFFQRIIEIILVLWELVVGCYENLRFLACYFFGNSSYHKLINIVQYKSKNANYLVTGICFVASLVFCLLLLFFLFVSQIWVTYWDHYYNYYNCNSSVYLSQVWLVIVISSWLEWLFLFFLCVLNVYNRQYLKHPKKQLEVIQV